MIKTSVTDPLLIDEVCVVNSAGVIGMTLCPGRKGSSLAGGRWDRDLQADLAAVQQWQPNVVLTLLERHEYTLLGIPDFQSVVENRGLFWKFLPIPDGGTPGAAFAKSWAELGPHVRNVLRSGGRVLIHCRAGLGRTGLMAASLMVELGYSADDAIEAVRTARPNTIETPEQEQYVHSRHRIAPAKNRISGILGSMYGAAIGDALGSAFEFVSADVIKETIGDSFAWNYLTPIRGSLLGRHEAGYPTDDTAMALSVARVVAKEYPLTADAFAAAFLEDLNRENGTFGKMFWDGAPGVATTGALGRLEKGADPATCGRIEDGGNGAAMRAHPVGLIPHRPSVFEVAKAQAIVTHGHPGAIAAAQAVAALVHDALAGLEPTLEPPAGIDDETFLNAWRDAHRGVERGADCLPEHLLNVQMSGWATVAAAHAISYIYQDEPRRAIAAAAASGGDTDTIASIAGAITGARSGVAPFEGWIVHLKARDEVQKTVELFFRDSIDTTEIQIRPSNKALNVNNCQFSYVVYDEHICLYGRSITATQLRNATRRIKLVYPKFQVIFESSPATVEILDVALDDFSVTRLFDAALYEALRTLGFSEGEIDTVRPYGGMGSDYRGFLWGVSNLAARYLDARRADTIDRSVDWFDSKQLAEDIIFAAHSVSFATRLGYEATVVPAAVTIRDLSHALPLTRTRMNMLRAREPAEPFMDLKVIEDSE